MRRGISCKTGNLLITQKGTRVRLCAKSSVRRANSPKEEQRCGHPPLGEQPKNWRATGPRNGGHQPKNWTGRFFFFFKKKKLPAPSCSSWTSAVACPRSRTAVVLMLGSPLGWFIKFLSSSPLPSSSDPLCRKLVRRLHLSVLSLSNGRYTYCHALCISFQLSTPPLAQFDGPPHVASGHRVEPRWSFARRGMCGNNSARARGDFQRVLTRNHQHVIMGCWSRCG